MTKKLDEKYYGFLFHYYRAEVYRETSWRNRLDITTNWAIVVTAAILSFAFGNPNVGAGVFAVNYLIVWFFLYTEARRLRYYALVRDRVKIFEKNILGELLKGGDLDSSKDFFVDLSEKLRNPKIAMSRIESLSWRLRKNYIFILTLIYGLWFFKLSSEVLPFSPLFFDLAGISGFPGFVICCVLTSSLLWAFVIAFYFPRKYSGNDLP